MDQELLIENIQLSSSKTIQKSINDESILKQPSNLFSRYNLFIHCYNKACNRVDEKTLLFVKESQVFSSLDFMLSQLSFTALLVMSFTVPILGILMVVYLGVGIYKYLRGLRVYRKNEQRVKDPFKKMRFDHVKCSQLKKNYHFFTINFKSLSSEFNFKENLDLAQSQRKSGQVSEWMIYNEMFASYFTDFPKFRIKLIVLLLLGIVLSLSSTVILLMLV